MKRTLVVMLMFCMAAIAGAQDSIEIKPPRIISVQNFTTKGDVVRIGDYLAVQVENLGTLVTCGNNKPPVLYLENIPLRGIRPTFIDLNNDLIVFPILRNDSTKEVWDILYQPSERNAVKPFSVSIGKDCNGAIRGSAGTITLRMYNRKLLYGMLVLYLLVVIGFVLLARATPIIRDGVLKKNDKEKDVFATYSLAKTQLALWTLIIIGSVGYIFSVTGELPVITGSTWILLAISIGTTAGAEMINISRDQPLIKRSKNFFTDILSDQDGINIHRFQMSVWSVFLCVYFISRVHLKLDIPQLSNDLLTLMGISSGTYLSLKIPEHKKNQKAVS